MTNQHPITPPPELVQQWTADIFGDAQECFSCEVEFANRVAQWGADMELDACCALMDDWGLEASDIRAARRPKPLSLKEEALKALDAVDSFGNEGDRDTIRRALEQLND